VSLPEMTTVPFLPMTGGTTHVQHATAGTACTAHERQYTVFGTAVQHVCCCQPHWGQRPMTITAGVGHSLVQVKGPGVLQSLANLTATSKQQQALLALQQQQGGHVPPGGEAGSWLAGGQQLPLPVNLRGPTTSSSSAAAGVEQQQHWECDIALASMAAGPTATGGQQRQQQQQQQQQPNNPCPSADEQDMQPATVAQSLAATVWQHEGESALQK